MGKRYYWNVIFVIIFFSILLPFISHQSFHSYIEFLYESGESDTPTQLLDSSSIINGDQRIFPFSLLSFGVFLVLVERMVPILFRFLVPKLYGSNYIIKKLLYSYFKYE